MPSRNLLGFNGGAQPTKLRVNLKQIKVEFSLAAYSNTLGNRVNPYFFGMRHNRAEDIFDRH